MRTLAEMSCGGLEWTRLSVQPQLGTVSERGHRFSCSVCIDTESFVTWMMDLGRSSLDGRDLGKWDACLGRIAWFLYSGSHQHMTGARDLFESFTESDSGMYVELGMGTKHAVQGSGTMSFRWSQEMC
jgi:hypothetical protein